MRGSDEHHQFYGWGEWNHGGIFVGGACSAAVDEPEDPVYGEFVFDCRDLVRSGVLPVQFPSEKPGEMFCRGCRKYRNCFYLIVLYPILIFKDANHDALTNSIGIVQWNIFIGFDEYFLNSE